ncbi:MAG: type II toxin-antitoxin system VapC family toxin [Candidatus Aenigmarchaeota archaeon]|nr:type II toxin-antitoxin system VapC family toxin [Candidatus Aenigmarchaeota archaeon]
MTLVFDTSILIRLEKRDKIITNRISEIIKTDSVPAVITFMSYFEFYHGLQAKSPKNKENALIFLNKFQCIHTTKETAHILSDLKHIYDKKGKSFSLADLLIASQAAENNLTLVTTDRQFEGIEELKKIIL